MLLGVDTGGTFTDFVWFDGRQLQVHKVLSTPAAPEQAILQGVRDLNIPLQGLRVIHGSTVATNAVLEGKGARTVYITNHGFADLLTIGRQARRELYNLQPEPPLPPVAEELCLETGGRLAADGSVLEALSDGDLQLLARGLRRLAPQAVAINLLFSFLDERFERAIEAVVPEGVFVSRSSRVLPEYREYERGIATWINAWVGPLVKGYVERLAAALQPARLAVMQSSGETMRADQAADHAVRLLLSGPAGGLAGVRHAGALAGHHQLLSFDMGGTSTDVALIDGEPRLSSESTISGYPVAVPMVDMHTIGAGGGSIARIDEGGLLQVGPASAGADPGPACYGRGGQHATVTDANLVLGRLPAESALGGYLRLDRDAAVVAVGALGEAMGVSAQQAALGVVKLANEHMAQALRQISVERGIHIEGMALACFGGAGGLHVCALAEALGLYNALVPANAGVLSAMGMLVAAPGRQLSRSLIGVFSELPLPHIDTGLAALEAQARAELEAEGHALEALQIRRGLDLRYQGQSFSLTVTWNGDRKAAEAAFHLAHEQRYGMRLDVPLELVTLRLGAKLPGLDLPATVSAGEPASRASPAALLRVHGEADAVPAWQRSALSAGQVVAGPAVIGEQAATTWVASGWSARRDQAGNLHLQRSRAGAAVL